jgi:predicted Rossmann fold flavoprotein
LMTQHRVKEITPIQTGFQIFHEGGQLNARRVIMATGGQSLPKSGSDGHGWSIVRQLGHTMTATYPALVPLVLHDTFFHRGLSGISHNVTLTTRVGGTLVDRRTGSLLWTHFGVSGPVVLDASRFWAIANGQREKADVSKSFFTDKNFQEVDHWLSNAARLPGNKTVLTLLSQHLPNRTVKALCAHAGGLTEVRPCDVGAIPLNKLPRPQRRALTQVLTDLPLPVVGTRGWNYAEVTAGGIPLNEVNPVSMASRKVPGLYLIGEMLDCDGRIGGYNFQWAWTTGYIAGCSAAQSLESLSD